MSTLDIYHKKSRILLRFLKNARHIGIAKVTKIIKKRLYCKINDYPNSFIIESASICNLSCAICWAYKAKNFRKNNFIGYVDYKKILDDIENICSKILLGFCGEPMLNSDIYKMIEYANQKDMIVSIPTNGMLLTKENSIKLLESDPYEVVISLDAANPNTYESIRVGGDFYKVVDGVRYLTEEKRKRQLVTPIVILQMVLTKKNEGETKDFIKLAKDIQVDRVTIKSLFIDHHGDSDYIKKLTDEFFTPNYVSRYIENDKKGVLLKKTGVCPNNKSPVIASDGDVHVCCFDILGEYKQGNALNENFLNIWNKPGYKKFRKESMLRRKLPLCRTCSYLEVPEISISLK